MNGCSDISGKMGRDGTQHPLMGDLGALLSAGLLGDAVSRVWDGVLLKA